MSDVTVLGLGAMGATLAACLLRAGLDVCVWNRTPDKAAPLVALGARQEKTAGDAIAASPVVITNIKSHLETCAMLEPLAASLAGKTVVELSTGDAVDAEKLVALLDSAGADYMIGMINAYPSGIGKPDTTILTVSQPETWDRHSKIVKLLGGKSAWIGTEPAALAAMFAGLFTARQGFMFGMIYGATVCQKAGVPLAAYVQQLPVTMNLMQDYYRVFSETVPEGTYDDPEASMATYAAALDDALRTFQATGAPEALPRLMYDQVRAAMENGLHNKQMTALVDYFLDPDGVQNR